MKPSRILLITILTTGAFYVGSFVALGSSFPTIELERARDRRLVFA